MDPKLLFRQLTRRNFVAGALGGMAGFSTAQELFSAAGPARRALPTTLLINEAFLRQKYPVAIKALLDSVHRFVEQQSGEVVDVGKETQAQRIKEQIVRHSRRPKRLVIFGDEQAIPRFKFKVPSLQVETDYFYGDLDGDGIAEAAVCRVLGHSEAMIRQLRASHRPSTPHALLFSADPREHLEMNRFAPLLARAGCTIEVRAWGDPAMLKGADAIVHTGKGDANGWNGGINGTVVSAATIPDLPRQPLVFDIGSATATPGSAIVRAFLEHGCSVYVGSASPLARQTPAFLANELTLHLIDALDYAPLGTIAEAVRDARNSFIDENQLASALVELEMSGRIGSLQTAAANAALQLHVFGDITATFPHAPALTTYAGRQLTSEPQQLKVGESVRIQFNVTPTDGVPMLYFSGSWDKEGSGDVQIQVLQNGKLLHEIDWGDRREYGQFVDAIWGGYPTKERYQSRALFPLVKRAGTNEVVLALKQAKQGIEVQIQSELQLWRGRTPPHLPPPQSVRRKGIKLLLLSYDDEYHAFRNTLLTVEDLQYDYHTSVGNYLTPYEFPDQPAQFLDLGCYDVILIGSMPRGSRTFPRGFAERVRQFVECGGGLIMTGGWWAYGGHFGKEGHGYAGTPIEQVLPVQITSAQDNVDGEITVGPLAAHPIASGIDWSHIPKVGGYNRVQAKPDAVVLARLQSGDPFLAVRTVGKGRTASITSAVSGSWGDPLKRWPYWARLWGNLFHWVCRIDEKPA